MTRLLLGLPNGAIWIPAAWDAWTLWGIDYRRTLTGIEFSTDGQTWSRLPLKVHVREGMTHPVTDVIVRHS